MDTTRSAGAAVTRWTLTHRRTVILFWLGLAVIGLATSGRASAALSHDFSLPGRESTTANQQILRTYGTGGNARPIVPVLTLPRGTTVRSSGVRAELAAALSRVERAVPGARIASFADTGDAGFIAADGRTTFALIYPPRHGEPEDPAATALPKVRSALSGVRVAGASFEVTGKAALEGAEASSSSGGVLTETLLIAGIGALVVLLLVFGSALAVLPLAMALVSIPTTFLLTWAITQVTPVSFISQFLISLIGLGVAIDYALLVVMRWREERAHGHADAVERAMRTAGSAVVFSGTTVAVGLAALIALPVPFLRSVGYAGLLIPLVSVAVATTLLPVLLSLAGARMDRRRLPFGHRDGGDAAPSRAWMRWARLVLRRRWIAAGCGLALVGVLLASAMTLHVGDAPAGDTGGAAGRGVAALTSAGIGTGALGPSEVITTDPARAVERLGGVPGVRTAIAPPDWRRGGTSVIEVIPRADAGSAAGIATLHRIRDAVASLPSARLGGEPAATADFIHAVYGSFPLMIGLIALVTFLLLARAFRSIVLPLKARLMDVLSIGSAWGVLAFVWQHGHGSSAVWGIDATGAITAWVPLMVFAFLFGLSMDYEVFLLARIREEHDAGASTNVAVERGMGHTARLITYAVLILVLALVSLTAVPQTDVKVLATGLAAGILLDATIIRAILVPALLSLFDRANWWLPIFAHRALRLRPAEPEIDMRELSVSRTD